MAGGAPCGTEARTARPAHQDAVGGAGRPLTSRLCTAFASIVGADGGSISLGFSPADRHVLCATDRQAEQIETLQDLLREGPALDAFRTRRSVALTGEPTSSGRWPLLIQALADHGTVPAIHAFPMQPTDDVIGVVTVHVTGGAELAVPGGDADFLADAVGVAILGQMNPDDWTDERWVVRDRISQATGMVVAQLRIGPDDALAVLRAHAFTEGATLSEVSGHVVARRLRFGDGDAGRTS